MLEQEDFGITHKNIKEIQYLDGCQRFNQLYTPN